MDQCFEAIVPRDKVGLSPSCGSIIALKDDRLMWAWGFGESTPRAMMGNFSSDEGRTWSDPVAMKLESGDDLRCVIAPSLVRLFSGALGLVQVSGSRRGTAHYLDVQRSHTFHISRDEGQTWSEGVEISPSIAHANREGGPVDCLVQLSDGRLIVPFQKTMGPTPTAENPGMCTRFGEEFSNCFSYNMTFCFAYYSDDEGRTWQRSFNEVYAMLDRGIAGGYPMGEAQVAELDDGRLLMVAQCSLGRLFRSYSDDRGETWQEAEPIDLALRRSPLALRRIPGTADVLLIWNQISPWEAMQGLYRHRVSCAVSRDGGIMWHHHKNLVSLDDVNYIEPSPLQYCVLGKARQPIDRERYHRAPGPLRNDHPYCTFHHDKAIIAYGCGVLGDRAVIEKTYGMDFEGIARQFGFEPHPTSPNKVLGSNKIHIVPIEWLYA